MAILTGIGIGLYAVGAGLILASKVSKWLGKSWREPKIQPYIRIDRDEEWMITDIKIGLKIHSGSDVLVVREG